MDAPERIWADLFAYEFPGFSPCYTWHHPESIEDGTEGLVGYIRADLHAAEVEKLRAERDAYRDGLARTEQNRDAAMQDAQEEYDRAEAEKARADALAARVKRLEGALVAHNDLLRSASAIAERAIQHEEFRVLANWDALHDRVKVALRRYHEVTNEARAALAETQDLLSQNAASS